MTDYTKLKRAAEAAPGGPWVAENDSLYFKYDGYTRHLMDADAGHDVEDEAYYSALNFIAAANPAAVLALIAENERLESEAVYAAAGFDAARDEIARLKAENEALRDHLLLHVSEMPRDRLRETFNAAYYGPRELGSDGEQCRAGVLAVIDAATGKGGQS